MEILSKILILKIIFAVVQSSIRNNVCRNRDASCVIESFGYSASCVISALSNCQESSVEYSIQKDFKALTNAFRTYTQTKPQGGSSRPRNCAELKARRDSTGIRTIYPYDSLPHKPVAVFCEQSTDRGGWTVIQRREDFPVRENFYRTWVEYVLGFGKLDKEFWLGLDNIHALTSSQLMELRIDMQDWDNEKRFAKYGHFYIGDSAAKYKLSVGKYTGDAGDSFYSEFEGYNHNGMMFTTFDNDNDSHNRTQNCAEQHKGAWWYDSCHTSNLNALPLVGNSAQNGDGISWHSFKGTFYSLKKVRMMIRPAFNK